MVRARGAIVCELDTASEIGAQVLRDGGNAADALIASVLAVGTLACYHSGIGGGGFALVRRPDGQYECLDFRSAAPRAAHPSLFIGKPEVSGVGGLSVAVPGELRGLGELHRKYGKLPWRCLVEPSIQLARDGFPATKDLLAVSGMHPRHHGPQTDERSWIHKHPALSAMYVRDGRFVSEGTTLYRPEFARTLEKIAEKGADAFYEADIAQDIVDAVRKEGGVMTVEDLRDFKVRYAKPLCINYRGYTVTATSAPSSGSIVLQALSILSNFKPAGPGTIVDTHRLIESLKFAYAHRTLLGDPPYVKGLDQAQDASIDTERGKHFASLIDDSKTQPPGFYNTDGLEIKTDHGTSHIIAADDDGLVISMTTTITLYWGSRIVVPSSGIVLNDSMADFSVQGQPNFFGYLPTPANYIEGGKRPLSSTSPFIVDDAQGCFCYSGGAAGGSRIISCNVQQARNFLDYGMAPADALGQPRLHDQLAPQETHLEDRFDDATADALRALGHPVMRIPRAESVGCSISFNANSSEWVVSGEPRLTNSGGRIVRI
ncbi:gamma-glutamyltranspeptidase [Fistulina hepatica ATCC 64428]|uniref:Gamma-glutamyltranspeptidase n=1 Tax=Fistulina hepatica ATCC 64428 TaxID=1128425 RepID=A0A0D7ARE5_9AGAR|nr:gamma-glutamyltranspeptidase [Fistulina hepatica ATCC 64428]